MEVNNEVSDLLSDLSPFSVAGFVLLSCTFVVMVYDVVVFGSDPMLFNSFVYLFLGGLFCFSIDFFLID